MKIFNNIKNYLKKVKKEHLVKKYIKDNPIFVIYIIMNLINSTLIRIFTINTLENYLSIKPIIADLFVIIVLGSFSFLFKNKGRYKWLLSHHSNM